MFPPMNRQKKIRFGKNSRKKFQWFARVVQPWSKKEVSAVLSEFDLKKFLFQKETKRAKNRGLNNRQKAKNREKKK